MLVPLVDAFFMIILRDPEVARQAGLNHGQGATDGGHGGLADFSECSGPGRRRGWHFPLSLIGSWVFGRGLQMAR